MYVLTDDEQIVKYPYTIKELKQDNPNVSFPSHFSEELLASYGVYFIALAPVAEFDSNTHNCVPNSTPDYIDGAWVLGSTIVEKSQEEKDEILFQYSSQVRERRCDLLVKTDWTQLADAPLTETQKQDWIVYRQALRDITDQDGFPFSVEWPINVS